MEEKIKEMEDEIRDMIRERERREGGGSAKNVRGRKRK